MTRVRERGHENFDDDKLDQVMKVAKEHSPRAYAMVQMLFQGALRIEDIVGPKFKDIKRLNPNAEGLRLMHFKAKKSAFRDLYFNQEAYDAVVNYQKSIKADDDDVMFKPRVQGDPTNDHSRWLRRFFAKYDLDVQSHDFRTSMASRHYAECGDILLTSKFLGHKSVKTTQNYIKIDQSAMLKKLGEIQVKQANTREKTKNMIKTY